LPTVLSHAEALTVIQNLSGIYQLVAQLLYGSGLRQTECLQLRVKDLDFAQHQIFVRTSKGMKSRVTTLPERLVQPLQNHLAHVQQIHHQDLSQGYGAVYLPFALERKYPQANRQWAWQFVLPADRLSQDPRTGTTRRHHLR
jgi:integrase